MKEAERRYQKIREERREVSVCMALDERHVIISQHTPSASTQAKPRDMFLKFDVSKRLCEEIGRVDNPWSVNDVELPVLNV